MSLLVGILLIICTAHARRRVCLQFELGTMCIFIVVVTLTRPPLYQNLRNKLLKRKLIQWYPQKDFMGILNTGKSFIVWRLLFMKDLTMELRLEEVI